MIVRVLLVGLAVLAPLATLAGPDYQPYVPEGWHDSVVARHTGDMSFTSAPAPTQLIGGTNSYLAYTIANLGDADGNGDFTALLRLDDRVAYTSTSAPASFTYASAWNIAMQVPGGRHTLWQLNDVHGNIPEDDESNNGHARQWVWSPPAIIPGDLVTADRAPGRYTGTSYLPGGTPVLANMDGYRHPAGGGYWRAVAVSAASDYDLRLYNTSAGLSSGFDDDHLASSAAGGSYTDAVVVNANNTGAAYDVGLMNYGGADGEYRLEARGSSGVLYPFDTVQETLAQDQIIAMHELDLAPSNLGQVSVVVRMDEPVQALEVRVYTPAFTVGALRQAGSFSAATGLDGVAHLQFEATVDGYHGIAVFRTHGDDGLAPLDYELAIYPPVADLAAVAVSGSHAPLVPTWNWGGELGDPVPAPQYLQGDQPNTNMFFHGANLGPVTSHPTTIAFDIDGETVIDIGAPWFGGELPGGTSQIYSQALGPFNVRGGRHVAAYLMDSNHANAEIDEDNNGHAEQWVWRPSQLEPEAVVSRTVPPLRAGGHDAVVDQVLYDNVDGLRSQLFSTDDDDGYWGAMAILAHGAADLDLRLHEVAGNATTGFDDILASSTWGGSACDFVLIDFDEVHSPGQAFDAGVLRYSGDVGYSIQSTRSVYLNPAVFQVPDTFQPPAIPAGAAIRLMEFGTSGALGPVTMAIDLRQLAGNADLGLALYERNATTGFYSKSDNIGLVDLAGPGEDERLEVTVEANRYYGVVVFKTDHTSHDEHAEFELRFIDPSVVGVPGGDDATPAATRIESVYPNPFNPQTTIRFAMRQAGPAAVKVYDLQGRLVRSLVDGHLAAGRHELVWNGTDDNGRAAASGVYLVRAVHADGVDHQRMSLVK